MSPAQAFQAALRTQEAIVVEQRGPDEARDVLGRRVMPCCGALDLGDSWHGGRPFQCLCQHREWREEREASA